MRLEQNQNRDSFSLWTPPLNRDPRTVSRRHAGDFTFDAPLQPAVRDNPEPLKPNRNLIEILRVPRQNNVKV